MPRQFLEWLWIHLKVEPIRLSYGATTSLCRRLRTPRTLIGLSIHERVKMMMQGVTGMNGEQYIALAFLGLLAYSIWIVRGQQIIIDRLMTARYGEYKPKGIVEEDASPKEEDPLSWHDH
jgi:hypothetical protein